MSISLQNSDSGVCCEISNTKLMGLVYSSGIATRFNLSNSTLIVLFALCHHYNAIRNDSFPSQNYIASKTGLSLSSIKRAIKELLEKGLIIKCRNKYGNIHKFTKKFFEQLNMTPQTAHNETIKSVKKNSPFHEQNKLNIKNKIDINQYKINNLKNRPLINNMIKVKYWKHKPSNKLIQVLPDIGNHLLVRFSNDLQYVEILETGLCDKITNFEVLKNYETIKPKYDQLSKKTWKKDN